MNRSLGILGGLGPLASTEFLKAIYEFNLTNLEQESPTCILYSDPSFPDQMNAILGVSDELLVSQLVKSLESLCQLGVSKVVIACVTIHYFFPKVPQPLREKVISLIDVIIKEVLDTKKKYLLLCSNGARQVGIFQNHHQWKMIEKYVIFPEEEDQIEIQHHIYKLKRNCNASTTNFINTLSHKYEIDSFIAGCTEFHLLIKQLMKSEYKEHYYHFVDPLITIAKNYQTFVNA